jgi:hypothetical protein
MDLDRAGYNVCRCHYEIYDDDADDDAVLEQKNDSSKQRSHLMMNKPPFNIIEHGRH